MTKNEIAHFFGYKDETLIRKCFVAAEGECESIRNKKNHYNKNMEVDYTFEETAIALKHFSECTILDIKMTPAMIQVLKDNFITRDVPYKLKEKRVKLTSQQHDIIFLQNTGKRPRVCATCCYLEPKTINKTGARPSPYCVFYGVFLNKCLPKRDIYKDYCETFGFGNIAYIFTSEGVFTNRQIDAMGRLRQRTDMLGIPHSKFKSKRKRDEPITIIRSGFDHSDEEDDY